MSRRRSESERIADGACILIGWLILTAAIGSLFGWVYTTILIGLSMIALGLAPRRDGD